MHDQIRYFRFVSKFVDAVTSEPLVRTLRERPMPMPVQTRIRRRQVKEPTPMPMPIPQAA